MTEYLVTIELKTPFWRKILRFFKLIKQREEFTLTMETGIFKPKDILSQFNGPEILILKRK